jgi:hypothetical protein
MTPTDAYQALGRTTTTDNVDSDPHAMPLDQPLTNMEAEPLSNAPLLGEEDRQPPPASLTEGQSAPQVQTHGQTHKPGHSRTNSKRVHFPDELVSHIEEYEIHPGEEAGIKARSRRHNGMEPFAGTEIAWISLSIVAVLSLGTTALVFALLRVVL